MTILESIGLAFVIFTSLLGAAVLGYLVWLGLVTLKRQRERGSIEEDGAIQRDLICRAIERSAS